MQNTKSKTFLTLIIFISITLFIVYPSTCIQATNNGMRIWLVNVVPALFPFFILTRILTALNQKSIPILDKFTSKFFRTHNAGLAYFLSILSGYPVGAKMISSYYEIGAIDKQTAYKMFSFCSTSGPMFIVGTIGIGVFKSAKVGYILLISHILGSFLNGIIYRGKPSHKSTFIPTNNNMQLNDIMYDSIISILLVGGYIIFASVVIQILQLTNIIHLICILICKIPCFDYHTVYSLLCGIIEITNGIIMLGNGCISLPLKVVFASMLIAFSGISIMLQSSAFLTKIGLKKRTIILQKITQTIITCLLTFVILLIL